MGSPRLVNVTSTPSSSCRMTFAVELRNSLIETETPCIVMQVVSHVLRYELSWIEASCSGVEREVRDRTGERLISLGGIQRRARLAPLEERCDRVGEGSLTFHTFFEA